jgi:hypothetical protein
MSYFFPGPGLEAALHFKVFPRFSLVFVLFSFLFPRLNLPQNEFQLTSKKGGFQGNPVLIF